jgi:hypothetical protein
MCEYDVEARAKHGLDILADNRVRNAAIANRGRKARWQSFPAILGPMAKRIRRSIVYDQWLNLRSSVRVAGG